MANRPSGPKELSEPIKWEGPELSEMADARDPFAPTGGLLGHEPNTPLSSLPREEQERILEKRQAILAQEVAAYEKVEIERISKLLLLCKHHGIEIEDSTEWPLKLCIALADECFPGMEVSFEQRRGRPKLWNESEYLELWAAIEDIKIDRKRGDADACRIYAKRTSDTASTVQSNLTKARNPKHNRWAKFFQGTPEHQRYMTDVLISNFGPQDSKNVLSDIEFNEKYGID